MDAATCRIDHIGRGWGPDRPDNDLAVHDQRRRPSRHSREVPRQGVPGRRWCGVIDNGQKNDIVEQIQRQRRRSANARIRERRRETVIIDPNQTIRSRPPTWLDGSLLPGRRARGPRPGWLDGDEQGALLGPPHGQPADQAEDDHDAEGPSHCHFPAHASPPIRSAHFLTASVQTRASN